MKKIELFSWKDDDFKHLLYCSAYCISRIPIDLDDTFLFGFSDGFRSVVLQIEWDTDVHKIPARARHSRWFYGARYAGPQNIEATSSLQSAVRSVQHISGRRSGRVYIFRRYGTDGWLGAFVVI